MFTVRRLLSNKVARDITVTILLCSDKCFMYSYMPMIVVCSYYFSRTTVQKVILFLISSPGLVFSLVVICLKTDIVMKSILFLKI